MINQSHIRTLLILKTMNQSIKVALQVGSNIGTNAFRRTEAHLHHPLGCRSIYKFRKLQKKNTQTTHAGTMLRLHIPCACNST